MGSKTVLIIVGILVLVIGVLGAIPAVGIMSVQPLWLAFVTIAIGVIALLAGLMAKK